MPETLIKVDLTKSPTTNENIHNRWHPDIPMACWVKPGDDFVLETYDWTGGFIKNNDSADDVRDAHWVLEQFERLQAMDEPWIEAEGRVIDRYEAERARGVLRQAEACAARDREKAEAVARIKAQQS